MLTSLPSGAKAGKALLPVPFPVSFSTSALPHSSDPESPSASHRSGLIPSDPSTITLQSPTGLHEDDHGDPIVVQRCHGTLSRWQAVQAVIVTEWVPDSRSRSPGA